MRGVEAIYREIVDQKPVDQSIEISFIAFFIEIDCSHVIVLASGGLLTYVRQRRNCRRIEPIIGRLLFAIFIIVPLIEIGLFIGIGGLIGLWPTLLGVVVTAFIGSAIIRGQGISLLLDIRRSADAGQLPAQQIAEAMMLAIAGALLLTPGYFTDACGFILLVPPIRLAIYHYLKSKVQIVGAKTHQSPPHDPSTIDLDDDNWRGR